MEFKLKSMRWLLIATLLSGTFLFAADESWATLVRGRVDGKNAFSPSLFPVPGTSVEVYRQGSAGWTSVTRVKTGSDGMYYLDLAPGNYFLQIGGKVNVQITVSPAQTQDIPPILIQF